MDLDDVAAVVEVAAHRVLQHVVGVRKCLLLHHVVAHHFEQLFVQHDDQAKRRVDRRPEDVWLSAVASVMHLNIST